MNYTTLNMTRDEISNLIFLNQVDRKFLLVRNKTHIFALDQHAVAERILKNQHLCEFESGLLIKSIEISFDLNVSPSDFLLIKEKELALNHWGFHFSYPTQYMGFMTSNLKIHFHKSLEILGETIPPTNWKYFEKIGIIPSIVMDIINSKSCRRAIMFGDVLNRETCQNMLLELSKCKNPFQCAHGRPSIVPLTDFSIFEQNVSLTESGHSFSNQ
jgi:DNA mismatch repair protein MLH3